MRYRRLDNQGDMTFGGRRARFLVDSPEAVAQAVLTRLRLWVGEWFLDTDEGTPYLQAALGTGTRKMIEPALRDRIMATPGVTDIEVFDLVVDADARIVGIRAEVQTIYGAASVQGGIDGNI